MKFCFQLVSFLLIGVASYAKAAAVVTSIEIAGGKFCICNLYLNID